MRGLRICAEECRPGETMIADEFTQDIECNWKFIPENLLDIYHVNIIHADTFGKDFKMNEFEFEFGPRGQFHATYDIQTMAPDGVPLFRPHALVEGQAGEVGLHGSRR